MIQFSMELNFWSLKYGQNGKFHPWKLDKIRIGYFWVLKINKNFDTYIAFKVWERFGAKV